MYLFNTESFNTGQKIYPSKNVWNYPSDSFGTLREIRPVTAREAADTFMIIKTDHEDLLQMVQKDSLRPYVQNFSFFIDKEKLKRQGSAALGTYIGTYIKHTKTREGQDVLGVYYAVRPNLSIMNNDFKSYDMPPYYKFANDVLYLPISFGGNEELITR
ncbi:hypothetical protein A0256_22075 [Mucilaginibacter sp. PAMC 26640]|nr:hypothetical protein A0256_22075 [Mucilaginibacter sp. PAMC 26640]